jgi:hypothetical protein
MLLYGTIFQSPLRNLTGHSSLPSLSMWALEHGATTSLMSCAATTGSPATTCIVRFGMMQRCAEGARFAGPDLLHVVERVAQPPGGCGQALSAHAAVTVRRTLRRSV